MVIEGLEEELEEIKSKCNEQLKFAETTQAS